MKAAIILTHAMFTKHLTSNGLKGKWLAKNYFIEDTTNIEMYKMLKIYKKCLKIEK